VARFLELGVVKAPALQEGKILERKGGDSVFLFKTFDPARVSNGFRTGVKGRASGSFNIRNASGR